MHIGNLARPVKTAARASRLVAAHAAGGGRSGGGGGRPQIGVGSDRGPPRMWPLVSNQYPTVESIRGRRVHDMSGRACRGSRTVMEHNSRHFGSSAPPWPPPPPARHRTPEETSFDSCTFGAAQCARIPMGKGPFSSKNFHPKIFTSPLNTCIKH